MAWEKTHLVKVKWIGMKWNVCVIQPVAPYWQIWQINRGPVGESQFKTWFFMADFEFIFVSWVTGGQWDQSIACLLSESFRIYSSYYSRYFQDIIQDIFKILCREDLNRLSSNFMSPSTYYGVSHNTLFPWGEYQSRLKTSSEWPMGRSQDLSLHKHYMLLHYLMCSYPASVL